MLIVGGVSLSNVLVVGCVPTSSVLVVGCVPTSSVLVVGCVCPYLQCVSCTVRVFTSGVLGDFTFVLLHFSSH